jgi:hypothetical protein
VYCHFFFSEGCAHDVCDRSHLLSLWLISHSDYSPTAPAAPSLRGLITSGSLIRCKPVQVYYHHLFQWCMQKFWECWCSYFFWLLSCVQPLLLLGQWPAPQRRLYTNFLQPDGKLNCLFWDLQSDDLSEGLIKCLFVPQTQLPSQASIPYAVVAFWIHLTSLPEHLSFLGSLYKHCPCMVPDDRVPCAVQEQHGRSTITGQQQTSAGTHHCPESISSAVGGALRLDAGPHICPPVLPTVSTSVSSLGTSWCWLRLYFFWIYPQICGLCLF